MNENEQIGLRIARLRVLAGLTQRQLADRIDRTRGLVGHIETGRVAPTDALVGRLAVALGTTVDQLRASTGSLSVQSERQLGGLVPQVRAALDGVLPATGRSVAALRRLTVDLQVARMACDYPRLSELLPGVLADAIWLGDQSDDPSAADVVVRTCVAAALALRPVGYVDLSVRLAERADREAARVDDPVLRAASDYVLAQAAHSSALDAQRTRALALATTAATRLEHLSSDDALVWYGMSNLQAALSAAALGRIDLADMHLAEALRIASRSPADTWVQEFSVANVTVWRLAVRLQAGDSDAAYTAARMVDRQGLRTRHRQARFALDAARAYAGAGRYEQAVTLLTQALTLSLAEIRTRPVTHELAARVAASYTDPRLPGIIARLQIPPGRHAPTV